MVFFIFWIILSFVIASAGSSRNISHITVDITVASTDDNFSHYNFYYDSSPTAGGTFSEAATSHTRSGLTASTSYDIEIAGEDFSGNIGKSNKITQTTDAAPGLVVETEDWEGPDNNPDPEKWNDWRFEGIGNEPSIITDPTDAGNKVLQADRQRPATTFSSSQARQEPTRRDGSNDIPANLPFGFQGSYQYRFYIPNEWDFHTHPVTITQFKPPRNIAISKSNMSIRIFDQHLEMIVRWQPDSIEVLSGGATEGSSYNSNGSFSLSKNIWYHVVIDYTIDFNTGGPGIYKYYIKAGSAPSVSDIVFNHQNGTAYNTNGTAEDGKGVHLKHGIYVWKWRQNSGINEDNPAHGNFIAPGADHLRLFFDDIVLKNQHEF